MWFFWITVNDLSFAFGIIILLRLHAVINVYIYFAFIERKNTWCQEICIIETENLFQFIPKEKLLSTGVEWRVLEKSSLDCSGDGDGLIFFFFFLSNSRGGVLRSRYCWWHCKHLIFITGIICIKFTFRAATCDVFYFTFWKFKRF